MTVPTPYNNVSGFSMPGCFLASDRQGGRGVTADGPQVRAVGGLFAQASRARGIQIEADPYKPLIDKWLEADRFMPPQAASYRQARVRPAGRRAGVRRLVSDRAAVCERWRQEHRVPGEGYLELEWSPGVMQVDFGLAQGRGRREPDGRALPGGLVPAFEHALRGGPSPGRTLNACARDCAWCSTMPGSRRWSWCSTTPPARGHRVAWDRITVVDVFQRFIEHYRSRSGSAIRQRLGEGQWWRKRGRVPAPQCDGAPAERGVVRAGDEVHALPVRRDRRTAALPVEDTGRRPVRRRARVDATPAVPSVRRVPVGDTQGR